MNVSLEKDQSRTVLIRLWVFMVVAFTYIVVKNILKFSSFWYIGRKTEDSRIFDALHMHFAYKSAYALSSYEHPSNALQDQDMTGSVFKLDEQ